MPGGDYRRTPSVTWQNPDTLLVIETVRTHLVGLGIELQDRGEHQLKRLPWLLAALRPRDGSV